MGSWVTENIRGIDVQYFPINYQGESVRIYALPGVPFNAGKIERDSLADPEKAEEGFSIIRSRMPSDVSGEVVERTRKIFDAYKGRQLDVLSVLCYAFDNDRFEEFASRLENFCSSTIKYIHPGVMMARTDVTAFFMKQFIDFGVGDRAEAEWWVDFNERNGSGLLVFPEQSQDDKNLRSGRSLVDISGDHLTTPNELITKN
ncbi:MAG: hypothetical protein IIA87_02935 [Nanoarchaeota archaeon]|nr:hypothetical protein [Nanoarchaeota archaeon]